MSHLKRERRIITPLENELTHGRYSSACGSLWLYGPRILRCWFRCQRKDKEMLPSQQVTWQTCEWRGGGYGGGGYGESYAEVKTAH